MCCTSREHCSLNESCWVDEPYVFYCTSLEYQLGWKREGLVKYYRLSQFLLSFSRFSRVYYFSQLLCAHKVIFIDSKWLFFSSFFRSVSLGSMSVEHLSVRLEAELCIASIFTT